MCNSYVVITLVLYNTIIEIGEIIQKMSDDDFIAFQQEIQYGVKVNSNATRIAFQNYHSYDEEQLSRRNDIPDFEQYRRRYKEIENSDIYDIIRTESKKRDMGVFAGDTRCAWLGLDQQTQVDDINGAITTIQTAEIHKKTDSKTLQNVEIAKKTIESYGIRGIFAKEGKLEDIFRAEYVDKQIDVNT
ncbi:hypothetical protein GQ473_05545 [archaeon]|nr:hypothetical protein [archaeon]